jgi:hypothetical protein
VSGHLFDIAIEEDDFWAADEQGWRGTPEQIAEKVVMWACDTLKAGKNI